MSFETYDIFCTLTLRCRNYRIDLENEVVRHLANNDEIDMLVAADQVSLHWPPYRVLTMR